MKSCLFKMPIGPWGIFSHFACSMANSEIKLIVPKLNQKL